MKSILLLMSALAGHQYVQSQVCVQTIPVNVLDETSGLSVQALSADAFRAQAEKTFLHIRGVEPIHTGRLLVLTDQSGSVSDTHNRPGAYPASALQTAFKVLDEQLGSLPQGISVEYGVFTDEWAFGEGFFTEPQSLRRSIADVNERIVKKGHGKTAIYDALHESLLRFQAQDKNDAILILTDGEDTASKRSAKQLEVEFQSRGVRLFIYLLMEKEALPRLTAERDSLIALARQSGGAVHMLDVVDPKWVFSKSRDAAAQNMRTFWNENVLTGYRLNVEVPANSDHERKWTLSVNQQIDPRLRHSAVLYPDRLPPCSVSVAISH